MNEEYQYNKEDVETALHFLSTNFPKLATPENAVKVLVYMHKNTISIENISDNEIELLLQDLEEN
jgi:hypothetical protein